MELNLRSIIKKFVLETTSETRVAARNDAFWQNLRNTGTELWLDTGDIGEAALNWTAEMSALTTNNTLLNLEIQKGIYDSLIARAHEVVKSLPLRQQVIEIAFILNARHGLRLAQKFGGRVSVELHTDMAHDFNAIVDYGLRYHEINPKQFIVKVPYTATGLLGARRLGMLGVPVNFTLEFSARQNLLVTVLARPAYLNVFLGRLGAYIKDNELGSGNGVGERAVLATQKWVKKMNAQYGTSTKLIAASLRSAAQLESLAGTDVYTIPVKVASIGRSTLTGNFVSRLEEDYPADLNNKATGSHVEKLWEVTENELKLAKELGENPPDSARELIERVHNAGCGDMFPDLSEPDLALISTDGKIPRHERWAARIRSGELAIDTLLNLAGLASFAQDQAKLDERIGSIVSRE
ncbi:MAG TPA: transaldolase family protein [Bacteroidales bacterium]|nr:transaldolase family protein [Bacteroidales bacterium]